MRRVRHGVVCTARKLNQSLNFMIIVRTRHLMYMYQNICYQRFINGSCCVEEDGEVTQCMV